jgi:hypothetical protein
MARILGSEGLIMNQANGNAYIRGYSRGKNDVGPYLRFNISGGNPNLHIVVTTYVAFTQTNGSFDFNSSATKWNSLFCDTGGNTYDAFDYGWTSGAGVDSHFSTSNRQADLWFFTSGNGGFPGNASIYSEIYCDRWDYLSVSNI